ncbi:MAG: 7-carboxy-7-deazaguanine synthase [Hahellaceae bacterium]|nr:7-carboxy-7-deazaguanine synthase [Hahellaceae bacterium]
MTENTLLASDRELSRKKPYRVKEMFYSLQGEGARSGRAAIFCRFSKCNLWSGRETDRATAVCDFCDTDFVGTDGAFGGDYPDAEHLADQICALWPAPTPDSTMAGKPYVIFTGGEPLLQLSVALIEVMHQRGFEVGVETNGTLPLPEGIDWVCVSPKGAAEVVVTHCDELKLVYPQPKAMPERFTSIQATHYFLSPMASPSADFFSDSVRLDNTRRATEYCLAHPAWRLCLQMHKILGIE